MKVILLEDVKSLGKKGDIVNVSDGYARNLIIPKKLGVEANAGNLNALKNQKARAEKIEAENLAAAKELKEKIEKSRISVKIKVGDNGKVFGSVSSKEIADAAKAQLGLDIDKKKLLMDGPIKELGEQKVGLRLHKDVTAQLAVNVEKE